MPLQIVGHLPIAPKVLEHRFVIEALAAAMVLEQKCDPRNRVIGTADSRLCELYGWAPNVPAHRDNSGWMYGLMLNDGTSYLHARRWLTEPRAETIQVRLQSGDVFRLNDFHEHWTEDCTPRVAIFLGSFSEPQDAVALAQLAGGLKHLEDGDYYGSPRVKDGYRALLVDECYAANDGFEDAEVMLLADARAKKRFVIGCHNCSRPAWRIDPHWPYFWENNRCREHLVGVERNARGDSPPIAGKSAGPADKDPMGEAAQFDPEVPAGAVRAALPPAANDDCQSQASQARAHGAPESDLAGKGAL